MSIHSSLKSASTMKRHRSVLTRLERVRILEEKGALDLERDPLLGLPKVKHLKIRIRKEKAAAAAVGTAKAPAAPTEAASAPAAGKGPSKAPASAPKAATAPAGKPDAAAAAPKKRE